jgi:hypothetical protein
LLYVVLFHEVKLTASLRTATSVEIQGCADSMSDFDQMEVVESEDSSGDAVEQQIRTQLLRHAHEQSRRCSIPREKLPIILTIRPPIGRHRLRFSLLQRNYDDDKARSKNSKRSRPAERIMTSKSIIKNIGDPFSKTEQGSERFEQ